MASECHRISRLGLDRSVDAEEEELRAGYRGWLLYTAASAGGHGVCAGAAGQGPPAGQDAAGSRHVPKVFDELPL